MSERIAPATAETAFEHDSTLIVALELSGESWEVGAVVPGGARRPRRRPQPRDMTGLLTQLGPWRSEALKASREIHRVAVTYEAGRDGFWIARYLRAHGIEVHIMHPASIPVEPGRRAKTDRIDLDMLSRTFLAWLRGEPRVCSMVPIPDLTEEDLRGPKRERERLVSERVAVENRIGNLLCLHGIRGFKPPLKKAAERLEQLRCFDGAPLPPKLLEELRRLLTRHQLLNSQLNEIETAPEQAMLTDETDEAIQRIRLLPALVGLGLATSTALVREVFARSFRDRRALAGFA